MKDLAIQALDAAARRGVTYADVRAIELVLSKSSTGSSAPGRPTRP